MNITEITPDFWIKHERQCEQLLNEQYDLVPLLNVNSLQNLKDGRLVKFLGMVQDMFNPEYYFEKYEVAHEVSTEKTLRSGKYTDILQCNEKEMINYESENNITRERRTFVLISVPGTNDWVHSFEKEKFDIVNIKCQATCPTNNKRSLDTENSNIKGETSVSSNKRICNINSSSSASTMPTVSLEHLTNFPLPGLVCKACHIKVYNNSETIKLNDLVEVTGFLSTESLTPSNCDEAGQNMMEIQTHYPPPSLIPRLHCVLWKKVEHNNCLVNNVTIEIEKLAHLKKELHLVLTQLFMGDPIAAEYLLYHLISKVIVSNELPIGKFALNVSHIPITQVPEYGRQLYEFIETLLPKSYYLPMTLENMNHLTFIPKKDYERDRITSGILQLSNNTHVILDETKLRPGQLNESGVKAIAALANTIKMQKVAYDFNYYPMEFDCDIPFLILSEGKSLLPSDFHVPLIPDDFCVNTFSEIVAAAKHFLNTNLLNELRMYLTLTRFGEYKLDDTNNVIEMIQNDFVDMRQKGTASAEDLHQLLVLGRLICLSEGKTTLDRDCWKRACDLESERKKRLS